jgi:hypothetical protein
MEKNTFHLIDGKAVLWLNDRVCETSGELLSSDHFKKFFNRSINEMVQKKSRFLNIFENAIPTEEQKKRLLRTLIFLSQLPAEHVVKIVEDSDYFFKDRILLNEFVEQLYNTWRNLKRLVISQASKDDEFDVKPYRTFNRTIEHLTALVRNTYRDIQENITGNYPRIYRQVSAGAEVAAITGFPQLNLPAIYQERLKDIPLIQQVLIYPPLIFNSPNNKRTGDFEREQKNPIDYVNFDKKWLCYPARVGSLLIFNYFPIDLFELNFSLCNLFELASPEECRAQPDAILIFGANNRDLPEDLQSRVFFHDDEESGLLVGVVTADEKYQYFGYLKKMMLTLHNIQMMKRGRLPYHGAFFCLKLAGQDPKNILIIGDTGTGKSETLEAMRTTAGKEIEEITIIADDMGSLSLEQDGRIVSYGTETGAFVRLDDLQPGYAFGQMDRAVIMNASQVNARVVIPITSYNNVTRGVPVDYIFYANNYESLTNSSEVIQPLSTIEEALAVFRQGRSMSKGTTTSTGITESYFANIFGPPQYRELHEELAGEFFTAFFEQGKFVGQMRTQLGVPGSEKEGPELAAKALLKLIRRQSS